MQRVVVAFASESNGGLIVLVDPLAIRNRNLIIVLSTRYRLPAIYMLRYFTTSGGLIAYGSSNNGEAPRDTLIAFWRARNRVICRCRRPSKYDLVINIKTAKAIGICLWRRWRAPTR